MKTYIITVTFLALFFFTAACSEKQESRAEKVVIREYQVVNVPEEAKAFKVNTYKSSLKWKGTKMRKTRGHEGTLGLQEGVLFFKNDSLAGGKIVANMNAISVTDIPAHDTVPIKNLTNHLKSDFNSEEFPFATFEITKIEYLDGDSLTIHGNMTIKHITRSIVIPAKMDSGIGPRLFTTSFSLDRFAWDIGMEGSWLEKKIVDRNFELKVALYLHH